MAKLYKQDYVLELEEVYALIRREDYRRKTMNSDSENTDIAAMVACNCVTQNRSTLNLQNHN